MTIPIKWTDQQGFSLIEALIALAILAAGFLALGQFQSAAIQGNAQVRNKGLALSLAENRMETLRGQDYSMLSSGSRTVMGPNTEFNVSWTLTSLTGPERQEATVTVSWTTAEGDAKDVQLTSWIARDPLVEVGLIPT